MGMSNVEKVKVFLNDFANFFALVQYESLKYAVSAWYLLTLVYDGCCKLITNSLDLEEIVDDVGTNTGIKPT